LKGVIFVFDNADRSGYETDVAVVYFANKPEFFKQLARLMSRSWVSFIDDMDPNNSGDDFL
jgi:triacylglycerol lipase